MNQLERLQEFIIKSYPSAKTTLTPPLNEQGVWFMDVSLGDNRFSIEWSPENGFGVSSLTDESYGERPDEHFSSLAKLQSRFTQLLTGNEKTLRQ